MEQSRFAGRASGPVSVSTARREGATVPNLTALPVET